MIVHLIDGTFELFRHFYGQRKFNKGKDKPFGAAAGVLNGILQMFDEGATHIGVATDHVIESFRNELWAGYKTSDGMDPVLYNQFHPLEDALDAMGVTVWPMVEMEADDALASAACLASADRGVEKVCIWTPDKDLAQCVRGERIVQIDRRAGEIRNEEAIVKKFGVKPILIPDFLALVGDSADGYPGIRGIGKTGAARLLNEFGSIENIPERILSGENRTNALLFKQLATLKSDAKLFRKTNELRWKGPTRDFEKITSSFDDPKILVRALATYKKMTEQNR